MLIIFFQPIAGGHVAIQIILQHDNDMTACSASQNKNRRLLRRWSLSLSQKMYAWKIRVEVFIINFLN